MVVKIALLTMLVVPLSQAAVPDSTQDGNNPPTVQIPHLEVTSQQEAARVPSAILDPGQDVEPSKADQQDEATPLPPLLLRPLTLGQLLTVNVSSRGIKWNDHTLHLVQIPTIEFQLDGEHLTACSKATLLTFDNAPYRAHVAVFDETGALLGTATADCETQRVWLGTYAMTWRDISFDFGKSLAYEQAKFFSISITDHEIQTPEQWQKSESGQ